MKRVIIRMLVAIASLLLRFRYSLTYKGLDTLSKDSPTGTLFLPNHPAFIVDPLLITLPLIRQFSVRPLIVEYMYYHPLFHWAVRTIKALAIPNFSTGFNPLKLKRAERMLQQMSDGLKQGESFLIYPAGMTKHSGKEVIGGAFGVHQLISENPNAQIVLVRMTGLWGSSFSRALTAGESPDTKKVVKKALWSIIKNLLFFVPKREVLIEFEKIGTDFPLHGSKAELNRYLEQWYNKPFGPEGEPLKLVSYSRWKEELAQVQARKVEVLDISKVPQEVQQQVVKKVAALAKVPPTQVLTNLSLTEHLGLDSLDLAEMVSFLEEQFDVTGIVPEDLTTVGRLYLIASKAYTKKEMKEAAYSSRFWDRPRKSVPLSIPEAKTIPEAFLKVCDSNLFRVACADPIVGVMSYYKVKRAVLLLSEQIRRLPGDRIGVLLPATNMAFSVILACQMAGKTPVMINWTVGGKHLDTVVEASNIQVVLSSWTFLDNLENVDLSRIEKMLLVLEEMKADIGLLTLAKWSLGALLPSGCFSVDAREEAVVLFTSGTESMPKGVPLTHANILTNQKSALEEVNLLGSDTLLGMLPPFHSFGFSITGLLPLVCGMKVVYYPNPTDSKRLAKAISKWKVTLLCSAPTFLKNILQAADKQDLSTLRLIISGAEKAPEELFALIQKSCPHVLLCEGYGITECAPVLTVNRSGQRKNGVGKPLRDVELLIVDADSLVEVKKPGEIGLVLARGPNVFSGYLNLAARDPFVVVDEKSWYQTGDLGLLSEEGHLILSGRLKRFIKIGGEMISLAAIEEALSSQKIGRNSGNGQEQFTVCAHGDVLGRVQLVLFTIHPLEVSEVNQMLRKFGFSNIVKIDRVIHLEQIPMTATGKVSYRQLEKMLQE